MSDSIYLKIKLEKNFYNTETSEFLFRIIQEGCNRHIAMTIIEHDSIVQHLDESGTWISSVIPSIISQESDECVLSLSSSFNFQLALPLVGRDFDSEVIEYRPDPLNVRLLNLQNLFKFIYDESIVKTIEAIFTLDYDIEELEILDVSIDDFAIEFEKILNDKCVLGICEEGVKVIWKK